MYNTFQLNMTLKIHVIIYNYAKYFELSGLTFRDTNGEFNEAIHSSLRIHEKWLRFKVEKKMETIIHLQKSLQSLTTFNSKRAGLTSFQSLGLEVSLSYKQHLLLTDIKILRG